MTHCHAGRWPVPLLPQQPPPPSTEGVSTPRGLPLSQCRLWVATRGSSPGAQLCPLSPRWRRGQGLRVRACPPTSGEPRCRWSVRSRRATPELMPGRPGGWRGGHTTLPPQNLPGLLPFPGHLPGPGGHVSDQTRGGATGRGEAGLVRSGLTSVPTWRGPGCPEGWATAVQRPAGPWRLLPARKWRGPGGGRGGSRGGAQGRWGGVLGGTGRGGARGGGGALAGRVGPAKVHFGRWAAQGEPDDPRESLNRCSLFSSLGRSGFDGSPDSPRGGASGGTDGPCGRTARPSSYPLWPSTPKEQGRCPMTG